MVSAGSRRRIALAGVIAEQREKCGLSQRGLSIKLEQPNGYIWKIENLYRDVQAIDLWDIAPALGLTVTEFTALVEKRLK